MRFAPILILVALVARVAAVSIGGGALRFRGGDGTTSVFGHKIPDTDAICSAIAYSWELNERGTSAKPYRLGELNRETEYVLKTFGVEEPPLLGPLEEGASVALVDTNNPRELPDDLDCATVHSIVDHHKLCGLNTDGVLEVDIRPLCSAGSILYARAKALGLTPPPQIAGLLLSCILSDSLEFRSPTTTPLDRELAEELASLAGVDMHAHAVAMLEAKAEIGHLSPEQVVMMDSKTYEVGGKQLRVSVLETTAPHMALRQKDALRAAMASLAKKQGLDDVLLFVVDILREEATFVSASDSGRATVEQAYGCTVGADGTAVLPGVLSRKKQIMPALEAAARAATRQQGQPLAAVAESEANASAERLAVAV